MKLPWLKSALDNNDGPFLSIYIDTTRTSPTAASEVETRWKNFRSTVTDQGAPKALLDDVEETLLRESSIGGRHGRALIATGEGILLNRVLPVPPQQESAHWGERPELLPLLQLTPFAVSQLLIEVDRAGADLHLRAPEDPDLTRGSAAHGEEITVEGGHDELHKSQRTGSDTGRNGHGWRSDNFEARVEDSWERNAEAVADQVNKLVAARKPHMVLLTGDVRATALLKAALHKDVQARLVELSGGTRGQSLDRDSFRAELAQATETFIETSQQDIGDRFREAQSRDVGSVAGGSKVHEVLKRGQVDELVFLTGSEPENIEELLYLAISTDAGVSAISETHLNIPDGVGAFLRWDDGSTPSNSLSTMSGDPARRDAVDPDRDDPSPRSIEEEKILG